MLQCGDNRARRTDAAIAPPAAPVFSCKYQEKSEAPEHNLPSALAI